MSYQIFDPGPPAYNSFNNMFGSPEISPLGCAGDSHFGYLNPINANNNNFGYGGWHVTTNLPKPNPLFIRDHFDIGDIHW